MINRIRSLNPAICLTKSIVRFITVLAIAMQYSPLAFSGVNTDDAGLKEAYAKIDTLEQFTVVLAKAMGRTLPSTSPILTVDNANILTLEILLAGIEEKMGKLQYQLLRTRRHFDKAEFRQSVFDRKGEGNIDLLIAELDQMLEVAQQISVEHNLPLLEPSSSSADAAIKSDCEVILLKMLLLMRNINALLIQPYQPSDVYSEINSSLYLWFGAMAKSEYQVRVTASEILFVADKKPVDVYKALIVLNKTLTSMQKERGAQHLAIDFDPKFENISPSDVYDLSVLTFARLTLLVMTIQEAPKALVFSYPGVKFPSHVYQRVLALHSSLKVFQQLEKKAAEKS